MLPTIIACLIFLPVAFIKKNMEKYDEKHDHITVYKHKKVLVVSNNNRIIKKYPVAFGYQAGKKTRSGDGKTPEGRYTIIGKKDKSIFTHSLHISYPNTHDAQHAQKEGFHPGDSITIHGTGEDNVLKKLMHRKENWTRGCIGMHNHHIKELFKRIRVGTTIDIHP